MATKKFRGDATALAQSQSYTLGGTWLAAETVTFTVNTKDVTVAVGSTTITTILDNLVAGFNDADPAVYPELSGEITATEDGATKLILTANTAGVPFTISLATNSAAGTISSATVIQASKGPSHWDDDDNWDTNGVPADGDDVDLSGLDVPILYGLSQTGIALASLTIPSSWQGLIGLKDRNDAGYYEYRTKPLSLESVTLCTIGAGPGPGTSRLRLSVGHAATVSTINIHGSAQPEQDGFKAIQIETGGAANVVNVTRGSVEIAGQVGQAATVATLRIGYQTNQEADADVRCGTGAALTTVDKSGGQLETNSAITTLTERAGQTIHNAGAVTTLNIHGGTVVYNSTGTLGTCTISGTGKLDISQDSRAKTITNPIEMHGENAQVIDPRNLLNNGTPALILDYNQTPVTINGQLIGQNVRITRSATA